MHVICVGLNHRTAPLDLRERLAYMPQDPATWLARSGHANKGWPGGLRELVILSTCNRLEYYAAIEADPPDGEVPQAAIGRFLEAVHSRAGAALAGHLYQHVDRDAARHL